MFIKNTLIAITKDVKLELKHHKENKTIIKLLIALIIVDKNIKLKIHNIDI